MMRTMRSTNEAEQIYFDTSNPLLKLGGDLNSINFLIIQWSILMLTFMNSR